MKPKQELRIFKATSIKILKSLYFQSKSYLAQESIQNAEPEPIQIV